MLAPTSPATQYNTVHQKIASDTRSPISLINHQKLHKTMRGRTDASHRDLLHQALKARVHTTKTAADQIGDLISSINDATRSKDTNTSNTLIHTVHSFDQALSTKGAPFKVLVMVGFKVINVLRIDHVHLTFYSTFQLFIEWNDPRLVNPSNPNHVQWDDPDKALFDPKIVCVNLIDGDIQHNVKELIDPSTGLVKQTITMRGNLTIHETSFGPFPYDFQDLRIQVKSSKYPGHAVLLVSEGTSLIDHHPREEFLLSGLRTEVYTTSPHASRCGNSYSTMHIVIMVERDPTWYQRNILFTLSLIWLAAMVTLFMPFSTYDALGYRMETAIALLLASVATKFTVTEHLPKVSVLTFCEAHMTMCFCGILLNIFTSTLLYVIEKYADPNSVSESMADSTRFEYRSNFYGGQPCSYGTMISAHCITFLTLLVFVAWHIRMFCLGLKHKRRRDMWRTLALPESLELCGRPLPSILTQFNGADTPVAKARDHLLSKFTNHLRRRSSSDSGSKQGSGAHGASGEEGEGKVDKSGLASRGIVKKKSASMYVSTKEKHQLIKDHSVNGLFE